MADFRMFALVSEFFLYKSILLTQLQILSGSCGALIYTYFLEITQV
jgi:hypothetical protein